MNVSDAKQISSGADGERTDPADRTDYLISYVRSWKITGIDTGGAKY